MRTCLFLWVCIFVYKRNFYLISEISNEIGNRVMDFDGNISSVQLWEVESVLHEMSKVPKAEPK